MIVAWSNVRFRGEGGQTKGKREEDIKGSRGSMGDKREGGGWGRSIVEGNQGRNQSLGHVGALFADLLSYTTQDDRDPHINH